LSNFQAFAAQICLGSLDDKSARPTIRCNVYTWACNIWFILPFFIERNVLVLHVARNNIHLATFFASLAQWAHIYASATSTLEQRIAQDQKAMKQVEQLSKLFNFINNLNNPQRAT